jgi:hypothetical protein
MSADMKQISLDQSAAKLTRDWQLLVGAGVPIPKVIQGMSGALSQLVIDAAQSGSKIPADLQPILETLIKMGGLTDAAARAMLGLDATSGPSLADIKAAADRYGLTLDQLGPKITQLQITDTAKQIVADFDLLMLAGADVNTVMVGMQASVQDMVTKALKLGLELPESMKPLIQSMIDAGLLTDESGTKLGDLSKLTFAADLTKMFDQLILKLDELISKITDGLGGALANVPAGFDNLTGLPIVPSTPVVPGNTWDPSGGNEGMSGGGMVPQYLRTGGRLLSFRPRGTDTVPAMLTPGEVVLNQAQQKNVAAGLTGTDGGYMPVTLVMEGEPILKAMVKVAKRKGWA